MKKKIMISVVLVVLIFSFSKMINVFASNNKIQIDNVEISDKSSSAVVNSFSFNDLNIDSDVTFYNIDDYVVYKVTLKNSDNKKYTIKKIEDRENNEYIDYEYTDYKDVTFEANSTKVVYFTAKYSNNVQDMSQRIQTGEANIYIYLEDEEGNSFIENLVLNGDNPNTGDRVLIYVEIMILSIICLVILSRKNKLKNKAPKSKKILGIIIFTLIITPVVVKASSATVSITFNNKYSLNDKAIVSYKVNDVVIQKIVKYGDTFDLPDNVEKAGYKFKGWYTKEIGGEKVDFRIDVTNDVEFFAQFDLINYNISYNLNGGSVSISNPVTYTVEDEVVLNNPEKVGYSFSGWTGSNGDGLQTVVTINKGSIGDKEFNANYSANPDTAYKVIHKTMNLDGATYKEELVENLTGATDTTVKPETKDYPGFTAPEARDLVIKGDGSSEIVYEYIRNKYMLSLKNIDYIDLDNSSSPGEYFYDSQISLKSKDKIGYYFTGWSDGSSIDREIEFKITDDIEIGPEYSPNSYSVVFDNNGGTGEMEYQSFVYDVPQNLNISNFSKQGYTFTGWKDSAGNSYTNGQSVVNLATNGSIILYAQYTPNNDTSYKVVHKKMDIDGVNYTVAETENLTGTSDTYVTPDFKSYDHFSNPSNKKTEKINPDGSTVIEYLYTRDKYTLTLEDTDYIDLTQSTETGEYYYETSIRLIAKEKEGYVFNGWSNGSASMDITFNLEGNITIKPLYVISGKAIFGTAWDVRKEIKKYCSITDVTAINYSSTIPDGVTTFRVDLVQLPKTSYGYNSYSDYTDAIYMWYIDGVLYWNSVDTSPSLVPDAARDANAANYFEGFTSLTDISGIQNWNISDSTSLYMMFKGCTSLSDLSPIKNWDVSNVTIMKNMFMNCTSLTTTVQIAGWNTSSVVDMISMFNNSGLTDASSLTSWDISNLDSTLESGKGGATAIFNKTSINDVSKVPYDSWNSQKPSWKWYNSYKSFQAN